MSGKNKCKLGLIVFAVSVLLCGCRTLRSGALPEGAAPANLKVTGFEPAPTAELSIAGGAEKKTDKEVVIEAEEAVVVVDEKSEEKPALKVGHIKTKRALLVHEARRKVG